MARYLFRLANVNRYSPNDVPKISGKVRKILGSNESASHFRIGTDALEFNLFAHSEDDLDMKRKLLEENGFKILTEKLLDTPPSRISDAEAVAEGLRLFNEERFWESHEVLEQIWRESTGEERDALQSVILAAAAFVHYQKGEPDIFLSVLKRARAKMSGKATVDHLDLDQLRKNIDAILESGKIQLFKLRIGRE